MTTTQVLKVRKVNRIAIDRQGYACTTGEYFGAGGARVYKVEYTTSEGEVCLSYVRAGDCHAARRYMNSQTNKFDVWSKWGKVILAVNH